MCMCSLPAGDLPGGFHKSERETQKGKKVSCIPEIVLRLIDLFLQRKMNKAWVFRLIPQKKPIGILLYPSIYLITEAIYDS